MHKNRARFRKPFVSGRKHFGYRFENGQPLAPSRSYAEFKSQVAEARIFTEEFLYFDVSAYFNNVYHHDLHAWFAALEPEDPADVIAFGKFFREINAGRSLDCLPQGLYPAKMIGNDFLRFIEASANVRAPQVFRFMDDVYLFGDDLSALKADFSEIQRLLGLKGLSVNAKKTLTGGMPLTDKAEDSLGELKTRLLRRRRHLIISQYNDDVATEDELAPPLDNEEVEFIVSVLARGDLSEDDAELIMIVMRDHADKRPTLSLLWTVILTPQTSPAPRFWRSPIIAMDYRKCARHICARVGLIGWLGPLRSVRVKWTSRRETICSTTSKMVRI